MATKKPTTTKTTSKSASTAKSAAKPVPDEITQDEITQDEIDALVAPEDAVDAAAVEDVTPDHAQDPVPDTAPERAPLQGVTRTVTDGSEQPVRKLIKKDLIDRVIARSGVKPRFVRQVTDALLAELGTMLEEAETLQLQPLGNLKVQRRKDVDDGEVIITRVKRKKADPEGGDPLAAAAE